MPTVVVILKPFRLRAVLTELERLGVTCVHHEEVRGYGRQKDRLDAYGDGVVATEFIPKIRLQFQAPAARVDEIVQGVCETARTGRIGDGKIFVFPTAGPQDPAV